MIITAAPQSDNNVEEALNGRPHYHHDSSSREDAEATTELISALASEVI